MFFRRSKEKELKMIWELDKNNKRSLLIGTAHFFPYSFKTALTNCLQNARTVMFEGPLDQDSMALVVNCGIDRQSEYHIFDDLDAKTIDRITHKIAPKCRDKDKFLKQVDRWPEQAQDYTSCYLDADLGKLKSKGLRFPSRHHSVINHRDRIFYERMSDYLKQGDAVAFVGAPHVRGMSKLLLEDGYQITGPEIPAVDE